MEYGTNQSYLFAFRAMKTVDEVLSEELEDGVTFPVEGQTPKSTKGVRGEGEG